MRNISHSAHLAGGVCWAEREKSSKISASSLLRQERVLGKPFLFFPVKCASSAHHINYVHCKYWISGKREKKGNCFSLSQGGLDVHQSEGDGQRAGEAACG